MRQMGTDRGAKWPWRLIAILIRRSCGGFGPRTGTTLAPTEATTGLLPWRGRLRGVRLPWKETRTPPLWLTSEAEADLVEREEPEVVPPPVPVTPTPAGPKAGDDPVAAEEPTEPS